jgi:hypothetical protein
MLICSSELTLLEKGACILLWKSFLQIADKTNMWMPPLPITVREKTYTVPCKEQDSERLLERKLTENSTSFQRIFRKFYLKVPCSYGSLEICNVSGKT